MGNGRTQSAQVIVSAHYEPIGVKIGRLINNNNNNLALKRNNYNNMLSSSEILPIPFPDVFGANFDPLDKCME